MTDGSLSVLCLDTAWLSKGDTDKGNLALGEPQVTEALKGALSRTRICLIHHPFFSLRDHEENMVHRTLERASGSQ